MKRVKCLGEAWLWVCLFVFCVLVFFVVVVGFSLGVLFLGFFQLVGFFSPWVFLFLQCLYMTVLAKADFWLLVLSFCSRCCWGCPLPQGLEGMESSGLWGWLGWGVWNFLGCGVGHHFVGLAGLGGHETCWAVGLLGLGGYGTFWAVGLPAILRGCLPSLIGVY